MIRAIVFASAVALAAPAFAAQDVTDKLDAPRSAANQEPAAAPDSGGSDQVSEYWNDVFPLPGESYGMFPDVYGNPHGDIRSSMAEGDVDVAGGSHAGEASGATIEQDEQTASTDVSPGMEGPDLRDATGGQID